MPHKKRITHQIDRNISGFVGVGGWIAIAVFATIVALAS